MVLADCTKFFSWIFILATVSILTTDVFRVVTIISLPIILAGAARLFDENFYISKIKVITVAILIALIPVYSWSGLDIFLWTDLVYDMCKWRVFCR